MSFLQSRRSLLLGAVVALSAESLAFQHALNDLQPPNLSLPNGSGRWRHHLQSAALVAGAEPIDDATTPKPSSEACYYRRIDGPWRPRRELHSLSIGERLFATRLPERFVNRGYAIYFLLFLLDIPQDFFLQSDLLDGKSGPKGLLHLMFLECGVGRRNRKGKWSIVSGMIRLGRKGMKKSVVRKKVNKIPHDKLIEVYVSKISLDEGRFEVCRNREEAIERGSLEGRNPASSFRVGEEYTGRVEQVKPYGVFVNINNANRNGLIHISRVAQRYDSYVNKENGLKNLGLKTGARVNVIVLSNKKKRLELDLVPAVEESLVDADSDPDSSDSTEHEIPNEEAAEWAAYEANERSEDDDISKDEADMWAAHAAVVSRSGDEEGNNLSGDEAAMWAAYAADYDEEADVYDEDADIEDALGIDSY